MTDFKNEIKKSIESNDLKNVETLALKAFESEPENENLLAFVSAIVFEKQIWSCSNLISVFVDRFPYSLHAIRIYFSDLLVKQKRYDNATTEARIYLRIAKDNNQFVKPYNDIVANSIGKGFLLMTSGYTEIGARSYSKRVLNYGKQFVSEYWQNVYNNEKNTLDKELAENMHLEIDKKWEAFFTDGSFSNELYDLCNKYEHKDLAKRIDLIEGNFRFNSNYKVDETEMFKLIFKNNNQFLLN